VTLHTDIPTRADIERLLTARTPWCVSIYLPTSPIPQEAQADRIELRNLVSAAMEQLEAAAARRRTVNEIREPLDELAEDDEFWDEQARSLAVFATPASVRTYRLPNRLESGVEVADRFYVKPLLRAITFPQAAFVLALAAGAVRLVEVTRDGPPFSVDVPGLPSDAASAAGKASIADRAPARRLQGSEGQKVRLRQYARKVDHALRGVLTGLELPLILAATEPLASIYRSVCSYPHLVDTTLRGNPDERTDQQLAEEARAVLDDVYARETAAIRDRFALLESQGRASADVATVARAATQGAVDTLLVDIDEKLPGHVDEETGAVAFAEDDAVSYGVVDEVARRVLLAGGRVLALRRPDVPGGSALAAILRYALVLSLALCVALPASGCGSSGGSTSSGTGSASTPAETATSPTTATAESGQEPDIEGADIARLPPVAQATASTHPTSPNGTGGHAFLTAVFNDQQAMWKREFDAAGLPYTPARLTIFRDAVNTACGPQSAAVGPFYCGADHGVYLDTRFFDALSRQVGVHLGDFAQAYVVGHEMGHHVQLLLGISHRVAAANHQDPAGSNARSVRVELQADCLAGIWKHSSYQRGEITDEAIAEALRAAAVVGDDFQQRSATGTIRPEDWTHGSSAQRQHWLTVGFDQGRPAACDTFAQTSP
jgi:predicted metalloprotease